MYTKAGFRQSEGPFSAYIAPTLLPLRPSLPLIKQLIPIAGNYKEPLEPIDQIEPTELSNETSEFKELKERENMYGEERLGTVSANSTPPADARNANGEGDTYLPTAKQIATLYSLDPSHSQDPFMVLRDEQAGQETIKNSNPESKIVALLRLLETTYHKPDLEGVLVTLGFLGAYKLCLRNPLWLHIVGASSSGKTTIALENLLDGLYADHHTEGSLTPHALMSGLTKGRDNGAANSLLVKLGPRALVIFKDLSNLLSKNDETIKDVAGTLRQVFDGSVPKSFGNGKRISWKGNWSIITAMTSEVERSWCRYSGAGERFLILRWRSPKEKVDEVSELSLRAIMQKDSPTFDQSLMNEPFQKIIREIVDLADERSGGEKGEFKCPALPSIEELKSWGIPQLAKMVSILRTVPIKEDYKGRASYVVEFEQPGRLSKQLINCALGFALLRGRERVGIEEALLMRRLAYDSVPFQKRWILEVFLQWYFVRKKEWIRENELYLLTPFDNKNTFLDHLWDMKALGVVGKGENGEWRVEEGFLRLVVGAQGTAQGEAK